MLICISMLLNSIRLVRQLYPKLFPIVIDSYTRILFTVYLLFLAVFPVFGQVGFKQNLGQFRSELNEPRPDIQYVYQNQNFQIQFKSNGISYELFTPLGTVTEGKSGFTVKRIDIEFLNCTSNNEWVGEEMIPVWDNYINSNGEFNGVRTFKRLKLLNLWDGVDMIYYCSEDGMPKYDFIIHGNKLDKIKLKVSNCTGYIVNGSELKLKFGELEIDDKIGNCFALSSPNELLNFEWIRKDDLLSLKSKQTLFEDQVYKIDPPPNYIP